MIYHIAQLLQTKYSFFNLFHYVSVRSICAFLSAIAFSFFFGNTFIQASLRKFKAKARPWTPDSHKKKNDTPTMGGLFIIMIFVLNALLWSNLQSIRVWIFLLGIVCFGAIGFLDDLFKIKYHKGIRSKTKFLLQIGSGLLVTSLWYFLSNPNTKLCVPFVKTIQPELTWLIIPWGVFIIVATSNAVNLTDGLDGLATGPLIFNFATYSFIAYLAGHKDFASYLYIPFAQSAEMTILGATLVGTLLGFLWYNTYPAQIFMGDVGSLTLGAGLALMALMSRQELILILCGGIFVIETLSVIIQVTSFKLFGKRMFRMAPIHHHFELLGWKETKITVRFWIVSIILSVLALLTLKIR